MTPQLIQKWLGDGLIDLQEAVELLNQLYARAATHERGEGAPAVVCYDTVGAVPMINSF